LEETVRAGARAREGPVVVLTVVGPERRPCTLDVDVTHDDRPHLTRGAIEHTGIFCRPKKPRVPGPPGRTLLDRRGRGHVGRLGPVVRALLAGTAPRDADPKRPSLAIRTTFGAAVPGERNHHLSRKTRGLPLKSCQSARRWVDAASFPRNGFGGKGRERRDSAGRPPSTHHPPPPPP